MVAGDKDVIQLIFKTHRTTIILATAASNTVGNVKKDVLNALKQFEGADPAPGADLPEEILAATTIPPVEDIDDFEICRYNSGNKAYTILPASGEDASTTIKEAGLKAWELMFLRFRDSEGNLTEVKVERPNLLEEEEEDIPA